VIEFESLDISRKAEYEAFLYGCGRGCEYNFVNLYLWGRQRTAFHEGNLALFSQFNRKSVYPFPVGPNLKPTLDAIIHDAKVRDIPCRLTGLSQDDCAILERLYPGRFRIHFDRDGFDYVYEINDLADLKGRKYQKKRNHLNRFRQLYPEAVAEPITADNIEAVERMLDIWYTQKMDADPLADLHMEQCAIGKALCHWEKLGMEGLVLTINGKIIAMTMGSRMCSEMFDVQFEKALEDFDGAYPAINQAFASHLRSKYPDLRWLNREDDMGLEGLRKAKLSYCPHHMIEKNWACLLEDGYDY